MPRPLKTRLVSGTPEVTVFKPAGVPANMLRWITMTLDEYEAIQLIDGQGYEQDEVAELLGVSRPTVTRILARGRAKLADMLGSHVALLIEGGAVETCARQHHGRHGYGRVNRS